MKVFISWSGMRSRAVAEALHDWLPNAIQIVTPWMSATDIEPGARWSADIASQLEETRVGVICLTPENLEAPWIHFEAGALSKTLGDTFVCPYLYDVSPTDLKGPLVQFQATMANEGDTRKLVHTINRVLGDKALPKERINKAFQIWWPQLGATLASIPTAEDKPEPQRSDRDILEEILELARTKERHEKIQARVIESRLLTCVEKLEQQIRTLRGTTLQLQRQDFRVGELQQSRTQEGDVESQTEEQSRADLLVARVEELEQQVLTLEEATREIPLDKENTTDAG